MRIAVASQDYQRVTGHAGKARRFLVFEAEKGVAPREVERLDLLPELTMHEFHGAGAHPLDSMQVVIAGSAGPGFIRRLEARGIQAVTTSESDPATAIALYLAGSLPPPDPHHDEHACGCH